MNEYNFQGLDVQSSLRTIFKRILNNKYLAVIIKYSFIKIKLSETLCCYTFVTLSKLKWC